MAQLWYDEVSDPKEMKGDERGKGNEDTKETKESKTVERDNARGCAEYERVSASSIWHSFGMVKCPISGVAQRLEECSKTNIRSSSGMFLMGIAFDGRSWS